MRPSERRRRAADRFAFRDTIEQTLYRGRDFQGRIIERISGVEAFGPDRELIGEFRSRDEALTAIANANAELVEARA